ncbi:MAG: thioredoxin family protein [Rhodothermaceae bacterium]|nr:thioredoxin family protein [Rhodothermaceae bacterium]
MKRYTPLFSFAIIPLLLLMFAATDIRKDSASDDAVIGEAAPAFSLPGTDGNTYTLEDLEGKFVVLEWLNFGCPYVIRHYNSGNMPELQQEFTGKDVVWLSIVSSAPGKQGYYEAPEMNQQNKKMGGSQTAILLDPEGTVGKQYGARTTPHMYIINPEGTLNYKGCIDDQPRARESETKNATNYVRAALKEAMNGKDVSVATSRPYGCSVKYN